MEPEGKATIRPGMHRCVASRLVVVVTLATLLIAGVLAGMFPGTTPPPAGAATDASAAVERVLVISLPHVAWRDIEGLDLPNLDRLFSQSAIAF